MTGTKKFKLAINSCMALAFILLMSSQTTEQQIHEYIGVAMLLLVCIHQYLNFWWYKSVLKMKRNAAYLFKNSLTFLTIVAFVLSIVSGIAMSKYALPFFRGVIKISLSRPIHLCATHWFFIFVSLHIGVHLLGWINRRISPKLKPVLFAIVWLISIYAFYLCIENKILDYLLMKTQFAFLDYKMPLFQTLWQNMAMIIAWAFLGSVLFYSLSNIKRTKK